jgi:hypothetical protein
MKTVLDRKKLISAPPQTGCVLSMPGLPGGGSIIYDRSPYGNIGAIVGAGWLWLCGGAQGLSFDGVDDYVDCSDNAGLMIAGDLTLEVWIKPAGSGTRTIFSTQSGTDSGYNLLLLTDNRVHMRYNGLSNTISTSDALPDGTWSYVAGMYSGAENKLKIFINGKESQSQSVTGTPAKPTKPLRIGSYPTGGEYFNGSMAMSRMYSRALHALQVQNHFSREKQIFGVW